MERPCSACLAMLPRQQFTGKQWQKIDNVRRCNFCMKGKCSACGEVKNTNDFSMKQWKQGSGRKCKSCVQSGNTRVSVPGVTKPRNDGANARHREECLASDLGYICVDSPE